MDKVEKKTNNRIILCLLLFINLCQNQKMCMGIKRDCTLCKTPCAIKNPQKSDSKFRVASI